MTMAGRDTGRPGHVALIWMMMMMMMMSRWVLGDMNCAAETTQYKTTIFCFFGQNINKSQHDFNVYFYPPDGTNDPKVVLICNWRTTKSLTCSKDDRYTFDEKVSDRLILTGPESRALVGGRYVCQTVPGLQSSKVHICPLEYREVPTTKPPPPALQPLVIRYLAGQQGHKTQHTSSDQVRVATFIFFLLVFVIVIASILHWKRKRIRQWWKAKRTRAPESTDVELEAESLTKENDPKEDESSPAMTSEVYYYNKGWEDACRYGFADKSQIPEGKPWLDPMKPDTEKEMPPKTASMLKGVYEAPVVREARLAMTREEWMEQQKQKQKQKQKMAKAERDKETREEKTQKRTSKETTLDDSNSRPASTYGASSGVPPPDAAPGVTRPEAQCYVQPVTVSTASQGQEQEMFVLLDEDANRTDPQDLEAGIPLMEGEQETDGERTTAPSTVDEARRQVRDADAKVQETKNEMIETKKAANKNANKRDEEVQTQAAEAKERYEKAQKVLEEAKSVLKTIEKAEKNKGKNKLFRP